MTKEGPSATNWLRGRQEDRDTRTIIVRDTPESNVESGKDGGNRTCEKLLVNAGYTWLDDCDTRGMRTAKVVPGTGAG